MDEKFVNTPSASRRSPMNEYLDAVYLGKNSWKRYLLSLIFILFIWIVIGSIPVFLFSGFLLVDGDPSTGLSELGFTGVDPLVNFLVTMSSFVFFFVAIFISVRFIHARPFRSLINPLSRVDWKRLSVGFVFWFVLMGLVSLFEVILYPHRYGLSFNPIPFLVFAVFAILLIPIQTACEELFFRGYLMQSLGLKIRGIIVLPVISGLIFGALHFWNPEMVATDGSWMLALSYFAIGAFAALITLLDGGLELALGLHAANNLYTALVANYSVSALPSQSIFTVNEIDPLYGLISLIAVMFIYYLLVFLIFPNEGTRINSDKALE